MDTVYKYCGSHGVAVLRNSELKITPPNQFNDPFEFTPRMICSDTSRYAKRLFKTKANIKKLYEMKREDGGLAGSFHEFRKFMSDRRPLLFGMMKEAMQHTLPDSEKRLLDRVSELHGVLCMSSQRDSILMWGHYCDKLLGLVIGFDGTSEVFRQGKGLKPVAYLSQRVIFDALWVNGSREMAKFEDQIVFSKSAEWSYEKELRQFFRLSSLIRKPLDDGSVGHFLKFPPISVVSVTLSPRCSPEQEKEVRTILQRPDYTHVKLDRAVLNETSFELGFELLL